ncbi:hypothetical protein NQ317_002516 [Molorchus minor]|uniref:CCHC-type domain-containing protein n=1 Tax=Molorchus minor TaxID=1323400 RepID=A0ABQ9J9I8_9CUCU|nr:hypothetical protein NQ317_002516 [Molorchus minor]
MPHLKEEKLEEEFEAILDYDDRVAVATSRLRQRLARLGTAGQEDRQPGSTSNNNERPTPVQSQNQVPPTNADTTKTFMSAVHENNNLDSAAKFNYLKSVLTGRALDTINGLTPSEACYNDAIDMLHNEYGNKDRIVDSYIQQLINLSPVKGKSDVAGLRKLYNITSAVTRSLTALGISTDRYSLMVKTILMKSLPFQLKVEFNKLTEVEADFEDTGSQTGSVLGTEKCEKQIESLLKFIKREVDSVESAQAISGTTNSTNSVVSKEERKTKNNRFNNPRTVSGLFTSATDNKCVFCDSNTHITMKCRNKNLTIEQKRDILKRNSRCYKCTKPNHTARECRTTHLICEHCKGRHSTVMCDPDYKKRLNKNKKDVKNSNDDQESAATSTDTSSLITNGCLNDVLLQTACAYISTTNKSNKDDTFIRIVLDGGSQLTFIKESVSKQLKLNVVGKNTISIIPFGSSQKGPSQRCNKVELYLISQYTKKYVKLDAVEVPEICFDALSTPPMNIRKLQNYQLADARLGGKEPINGISMLIGADNYWKIVNGETEKSRWTLHGPTPVDSYSVNLNIATVLHAKCVEKEFDVKHFWDLETIGIESSNNDSAKSNDNFTEQFCKKNIQMRNDRYEVALPWKHENIQLNDNYEQALARVKGLTRKLVKNSKLNEYDDANKTANMSPCPKILGILWYTAQDELSVNLEPIINYVDQEKVITKRFILKTISRIYDPLGFLGPFVIVPKNIDASYLEGEFGLGQCVVEKSQMAVQLHIFADASPQAYGATAYIRTYDIDYDENVVLAIQSNEKNIVEKPEALFDLSNYSSLEKVLRITTYIRRYVNNLNLAGDLQVDELKLAERYWLKYIQETSFPDEIKSLKSNLPLNKNSVILTLRPFLDDDGIMRLGGRLQESEFSYETRHPIILPKSKIRLNKFWKKWSTDYLQQLRSAHHSNPQKSTLFKEEHAPCSVKLVRITNLFYGRDGKVRACEVRLPNGKIFKRPVQLLYPLELENEE